jgi:hypothetical protein
VTFRLYLDEHVDNDLAALLERAGDFRVLTTAGEGRASKGFTDEEQLQYATDHGCAILTFNIPDFDVIAREWAEKSRDHGGILISTEQPVYRLVRGIQELAHWHPDGIANLYLSIPLLR